MKVPNLGEAHCGEGAEQSMQVLLGGRDWSFCSYDGERERKLDGLSTCGRFEREIGVCLGTLLFVSGSTSHILSGAGTERKRSQARCWYTENVANRAIGPTRD